MVKIVLFVSSAPETSAPAPLSLSLLGGKLLRLDCGLKFLVAAVPVVWRLIPFGSCAGSRVLVLRFA